MDREKFGQIFDGMSIQRNLKAVGTFAYQIVLRKIIIDMRVSLPPLLVTFGRL